MESHLGFAAHIGQQFFIPGYDEADVRQEAFAGLVEAARDYKPDRGVFTAFAGTVIRRRIFDRIRREQRENRKANHLTVGDIDVSGAEGEPIGLIEALPDRDSDPADVAERRRRFRAFVDGAAALTATEREALRLVYDGEEYANRPDHKSIDNAVQRARKKLREAA